MNKPKETAKQKIVKKLMDQPNPNGMFAIFARSPSGQRAHFRALFDTEAEAFSVAQEYSAEFVKDGYTDFTFYVVEIKSRMGIEHGRYVCK
jgi:hypothetical protein